MPAYVGRHRAPVTPLSTRLRVLAARAAAYLLSDRPVTTPAHVLTFDR